MKSALAVVMLLCASPSFVRAEPSLLERAAAASRAGDHAGAAVLYRDAYRIDSDSALLVRIGEEQRLAGDARGALASFCSYMYVDAVGELSDEASQNARALAAALGNDAQTDHDACSTRATAPVTRAALNVSIPPPRITKREVAGLVLIGGSLVSLGVALIEARAITQIDKDVDVAHSSTELDALADRRADASLRQKLFLGIGGATFITGSVLYVLGHQDRKRAERAYVAPIVNSKGGGLVLGGHF